MIQIYFTFDRLSFLLLINIDTNIGIHLNKTFCWCGKLHCRCSLYCLVKRYHNWIGMGKSNDEIEELVLHGKLKQNYTSFD